LRRLNLPRNTHGKPSIRLSIYPCIYQQLHRTIDLSLSSFRSLLDALFSGLVARIIPSSETSSRKQYSVDETGRSKNLLATPRARIRETPTQATRASMATATDALETPAWAKVRGEERGGRLVNGSSLFGTGPMAGFFAPSASQAVPWKLHHPPRWHRSWPVGQGNESEPMETSPTSACCL
jgi:hypothetical protein